MIKPGTYNPNQTGNQTIKVIYGGKRNKSNNNSKRLCNWNNNKPSKCNRKIQ